MYPVVKTLPVTDTENGIFHYSYWNKVTEEELTGTPTQSGTSGFYTAIGGRWKILHLTYPTKGYPSRVEPSFNRFEATTRVSTGPSELYDARCRARNASGQWLWYRFLLSGRIANRFVGYSIPALPPEPIYNAERYNSVVGSSIRDAYSDFNAPNALLSVSAAEAGQTLAMLRRPLSGLQSLAQDMYRSAQKASKSVKGLNTKSQKLADALSSTWLEYRYGIMPLIYDASAIIEGYRNRTYEFKTVRGKSSLVTDYFGSTNGQWTSYDLFLGLCFRISDVRKVELKANTVLAYRDRLEVEPWKWHLWENGFHPSQLPSIAWEMTKLSFVVDWFIDVGGFIASLEYNPVRKFLGQCTSYKELTKVTRSLKDASYYQRYAPDKKYVPVDSQVSIPYAYEYQTLIRRPNEDVPIWEGLLSPSMTMKRQIDALSLSWGRVPKDLRSPKLKLR